MATTIKPIIYSFKETADNLDTLKDGIINAKHNDATYLLDYPTVYIHVWQNKYDTLNNRYSIYVGESIDIVQRTKEHWANAKLSSSESRDKQHWQYHLIEDKDIDGNPVKPEMFVIGHKNLNKSLTLDIENRLIDYVISMPTANPQNGRGNPQNDYNNKSDLDSIYGKIWKALHDIKPELFLSESLIKKSAIYKASPNHKLTDDQKRAESLIIERTVDAVMNYETNQLIFVEGEAGTGKTVLTNRTFYDILEHDILKHYINEAYLLINHNEQLLLNKNIARRLGYDDSIVENPTHFLKTHSILSEDGETYLPDPNKKADIVFVDEAHLLWNQSNQAFNGKFKKPQLDEIMARSKVTVIMYDMNQVMHKGQIAAYNYMEEKRIIAMSQGVNPNGGEKNYIELKNQLRMQCGTNTQNWIDTFSKGLKITDLHLNQNNEDEKKYEVIIFDDAKKMYQAIKQKASKDDTKLSRMLATYDWEYVGGKNPTNGKYWSVNAGNLSLPWNEEIYHRDLENTLDNKHKKKYANLDWAEKDYTIDEVGSTFTIQGFDLMYAGVILGPSVRYDDVNKVAYFDESKRAWDKMKGTRKMPDGKVINVTNVISRNELRVLLTRATQGLYIYACDPKLRKALKECIKKS